MKKIFFFFLLITYLISPCANAADFDFKEVSIDSIQTAIKSGKAKCTDIIAAYLDRIKQYNLSITTSAPINAFTAINPELLNEARNLDAAYKKTHALKGPLHCIPVIIKDNIDTFDTTSTSGTLALLGNQPVKDAFLIARIRAAGGIIIGKGAMDELANGLAGISSRSGRTGNAYNPDLNPGGSSSGSAAAVSMNFALLGVGSDNSGSVRIPAAFNGVTGLRPSMGLISQNGIFPRGNMDGTAGPIAANVHDLAVLLDVIAHEDTQDKNTRNIKRPETYTAFLLNNGLQGKRIGIIKSVGKYEVAKNQNEELVSALNDMQTIMRQQGATIVPDIVLQKFDNNRKNNEAGEYQDINDYLAAYPAVRKNYMDICQSDRTRTLGKNIKACLAFIRKLPARGGWEYRATLQMFKRNQEYVHKLMDQYHLDALIMPISKTGSATYNAKLVNTWQAPVSSNAGLPSITMNIGYTKEHRMPIGIELIGRQYAEGDLIAIAYAFEQHSEPRELPALPAPNAKFTRISIAEMNNLFSNIGYTAYQQVLKNGTLKDLTAQRFKTIIANMLDNNFYKE